MYEKLYTQRLFADQIGARLEFFRVQSYSPYRANFRCPICGDSQKNKFRKRGYFIEETDSLIFYCHNECGSMSFERFMKDYYGDIYTSYKFDLFRSMKFNNYEPEIKQIDKNNVRLNDIELQKAVDIPAAVAYLKGRKIPEWALEDIFFTDHFHRYVNEIIPDKFPESLEDKIEPRIILPMRGYDKKIFGIISRSLDIQSESRYLTIKFDEESPKIFGLDRMSRDRIVYVTEGPIDSFFVDNCIALAGTDGNPDNIFSSKSDYVMILDNQPRSESIIKKYQMYMDRGCQMFIWPFRNTNKDINDWLIKENIEISKLNDIIKQNTFNGLKLKIRFNDWKKV